MVIEACPLPSAHHMQKAVDALITYSLLVVHKLRLFSHLDACSAYAGFYPGKSASPPLHSHDFQEECFTVNAGRYCHCVLIANHCMCSTAAKAFHQTYKP